MNSEILKEAIRKIPADEQTLATYLPNIEILIERRIEYGDYEYDIARLIEFIEEQCQVLKSEPSMSDCSMILEAVIHQIAETLEPYVRKEEERDNAAVFFGHGTGGGRRVIRGTASFT